MYKDFSLYQRVQTGSGVVPISKPMGNVSSFLGECVGGGEQPGLRNDLSPPSNTEIDITGIILLNPMRLSVVVPTTKHTFIYLYN